MVAVTSPKKSENVIGVAAAHALGMGAELIVLRVIPDPVKVGVVAQLISSERPLEKATEHIDKIVEDLKRRGINVRGEIRTGKVASTIVKTAEEEDVDILFAGACHPDDRGFLMNRRDPIMEYLVDKLPTTLCIVRTTFEQENAEDDNGENSEIKENIADG
ncbi:MAG: universal stress protein [Cyanobacteriota/Melainabacteria group bacterium]